MNPHSFCNSLDNHSYIFEVKKGSDYIVSGEINVVSSIFNGLLFRQTKFICFPILLLTCLYLKLTLQVILLCFAVYCLVLCLVNLVNYVTNRLISPVLLLTFVINMTKYISLCVTLLSIWLFIEFEWMPFYVPLGVISLNIAAAGFRLGISTMPRTYLDGQLLDFMESIQILLLFVKLTNLWNLSWYWTLFPYQLFIWFLTFVGYISAFFFPFMFGIFSITPQNSPTYFSIKMSVWVFSHVLWKAPTYYYLFHNFRLFLMRVNIGKGTVLFAPTKTLVPMMIVLIVSGVYNIVAFFYQKKSFKKLISMKTMILTTTKGVKREYMTSPLDMNIVQAGTNFFKLIMSTKNLPDPSTQPENPAESKTLYNTPNTPSF